MYVYAKASEITLQSVCVCVYRWYINSVAQIHNLEGQYNHNIRCSLIKAHVHVYTYLNMYMYIHMCCI